MLIGAILPHTDTYGGVKRFLELGNRFIHNGHEFVILCPEKCWPTWFRFHGNTDTFDNISFYRFDVIFFTEVKLLNVVLQCSSKLKIFYHVYRRNYLKYLKDYPEIMVFVNSTNMYIYDRWLYPTRKIFKAIGGVELHDYQRPELNPIEIKILTYGRLSKRKKGTHLVVKACENLYKKGVNIKLILFDTITDKTSQKLVEDFHCDVPHEFILNRPFHENVEFFREAHMYVSAERKAGWSNTTAEAMAVGLPAVATTSGTRDFLIHKKTGIQVRRNVVSIQRGIHKLIQNPALYQELSKNGYEMIRRFSWENLYNNIYQYITSSGAIQNNT
jgi:glycosyltransferase involved in cell wall biosynthesis